MITQIIKKQITQITYGDLGILIGVIVLKSV